MARIFSVGFELNSATAGVEFSSVSSTPVITASNARSGSYAGHITSLASGTVKSFNHQFHGTPAGGNGAYFKSVYLYITTLPSAENRIISLRDTNAGADRAYITLGSDGTLKLYDEDGVIGSSSSVLSTGIYYKIDLQFDKSGAGGSHVVRARLNNIEFAGASNRNISAGVDTSRLGGNLGAEAQTQGDWQFDDWKLNDATGSFETSYPGTGFIIHLKPNAAGDNNQLGSAASTNYQAVDEVTPDDSSTTITSVSDSQGEIDDYALENTPDSLNANSVINLVSVGVRFAGGGASDNDSFCLRIKATASGTVEESSDITPANSTYRTHAVSAPRNPALTLYDLPGAPSVAWSKADLDSAQIGWKKTVDSTNGAVISTLWLLVDYIPFNGYPKIISY